METEGDRGREWREWAQGEIKGRKREQKKK